MAVAEAISEFELVTMLVSAAQYANARAQLPEKIQVVEMSSNDAWARDIGPSFLVDDAGGLRACDWTFNAWGGLVDGLYFPWDKDEAETVSNFSKKILSMGLRSDCSLAGQGTVMK